MNSIGIENETYPDSLEQVSPGPLAEIIRREIHAGEPQSITKPDNENGLQATIMRSNNMSPIPL